MRLIRSKGERIAVRFVGIFDPRFKGLLDQFAQPGLREKRPDGALPSDVAQLFGVARTKATSGQRLTPQIERDFLGVALPYVQRATGIDGDVLVHAVNLKLLLKNPRTQEHAQELRDELGRLDEEYVARRRDNH